jgi:hypothetical protein
LEPQGVDDGLGATVQVLVPLHVTVVQVVSVQMMSVPWHRLSKQASS